MNYLNKNVKENILTIFIQYTAQVVKPGVREGKPSISILCHKFGKTIVVFFILKMNKFFIMYIVNIKYNCHCYLSL